jgi:hypothetical protein
MSSFSVYFGPSGGGRWIDTLTHRIGCREGAIILVEIQFSAAVDAYCVNQTNHTQSRARLRPMQFRKVVPPVFVCLENGLDAKEMSARWTREILRSGAETIPVEEMHADRKRDNRWQRQNKSADDKQAESTHRFWFLQLFSR